MQGVVVQACGVATKRRRGIKIGTRIRRSAFIETERERGKEKGIGIGIGIMLVAVVVVAAAEDITITMRDMVLIVVIMGMGGRLMKQMIFLSTALFIIVQ
jgi:hypothetical protein